MAIDNDLSALLPEPPPARPARREAAIEAALRRFDGVEEQAPPARAPPAPARGGWWRPQFAVLASAALVVLVSVPIWWAEKDRVIPNASQVAPSAAENSPAAAPTPGQRAPQQAAQPGPSPTAISASPPGTPIADTSALPDAREEALLGQASAPAPAPMPAAPRRAASPEVSDGAIMVTGSRVARQNYESNSPITTVDEQLISHGDWNDCTVVDPQRDLGACRALADPAAQGDAGRAATRLADGLTLAWEGELEPAIDAFDRAIRAEPDLSIAYLNRGLAYQAKGDLRRALADLNRAIARDPDSARGYYHRSLLHRARGDTARADADAKRAIELDPEYGAVVP